MADSKNRAHPIIRQIINRDCHVGETNRAVIRHVISKLRDGYPSFRRLSKQDRRLFLRDCIQVHRQNRRLYSDVMNGFPRRRRKPPPRLPTVLSGAQIVALMRRHRRTIRALAFRMGITQRRVRQVRERGLDDPMAVRDWIEFITGVDPGPIPKRCRAHGGEVDSVCHHCGCGLATGSLSYRYVGETFCSETCCRHARGWT